MRLEHDEDALETRVIHEANDATFRYRYLPNGSLQDITDLYVAQRQFLYDDDGRLKAEVDGTGGFWPVVRDGVGAPEQVDAYREATRLRYVAYDTSRALAKLGERVEWPEGMYAPGGAVAA